MYSNGRTITSKYHLETVPGTNDIASIILTTEDGIMTSAYQPFLTDYITVTDQVPRDIGEALLKSEEDVKNHVGKIAEGLYRKIARDVSDQIEEYINGVASTKGYIPQAEAKRILEIGETLKKYAGERAEVLERKVLSMLEVTPLKSRQSPPPIPKEAYTSTPPAVPKDAQVSSSQI